MENKYEQMATMSQSNHQIKIFKNKKKYEKSNHYNVSKFINIDKFM